MKKASLLLASVFTLLGLCGCNNSSRHKVTEIEPYLFEVPTYTSLDENYADKYFEKNYNNWGGGCSAIVKTITDPVTKEEKTIVGRNMDLNVSNKCAYIIRTDVPGKNKTFGLIYTFRDISDDYDIVKEKGISDEFYKIMPFMCDDVMNDKGLYCEINMRNGECWPDGTDKYSISGTNPNSDHKVYVFELTRYIAENCSRVSDVEEYIKSLNIYTKEGYWSYALIIADKYGDYGLLEFGKDPLTSNPTYYWQIGENCQTNYYINPYLQGIEDLPCGIGRYHYLQDHIEYVETKSDMYDLMKDISYSQIYDCYTCKFDCRSEMIGSIPSATYFYIMNEELTDEVYAIMYAATEEVRNMTREQKAAKNQYWESSFTEVADTKEMSIICRFFENENKVYRIDFSGYEKMVTVA